MKKKNPYVIWSWILVLLIVLVLIALFNRRSLSDEVYMPSVPKFAGVIENISPKYYEDEYFGACTSTRFNQCLEQYHFKLNLSWSFLDKLNVLSTMTFHQEFDDCIWNAIYSCYSDTLSTNSLSGWINTCFDYPDQTAIDNCLAQTIPREAIAKNDENICSELRVDYLVQDCKNNYYIQNWICDKIENEVQRGDCNDEKVMKNLQNFSDCKNIKNIEKRSRCESNYFTNLAISQNNIALCNNYKDQNKDFCVGSFVWRNIVVKAINYSDCEKIKTYEQAFASKWAYSLILNWCYQKFWESSTQQWPNSPNDAQVEWSFYLTWIRWGN